MSNFQSVKKFMQTFDQEVKNKAEFPNEKVVKLRVDLIKEELDELGQAIKDKDIKEVADALTDILYVTYGAGHAFGIDLDKCFEEVQQSNMSKIGMNGKPIYNENGKVMKGPNYFKPEVFTINNFYFPNTVTDPIGAVTGNVNDSIIISVINSGQMISPMHFHGYHVKIIDVKIIL